MADVVYKEVLGCNDADNLCIVLIQKSYKMKYCMEIMHHRFRD